MGEDEDGEDVALVETPGDVRSLLNVSTRSAGDVDVKVAVVDA